MHILAKQEIPLGDYIEASNALIIDQGVTVFALVVFAIVIFGILWIMYIESKQQSKTLDILMTISKGIGGMETSVNTLAADAKLSKTELIGKAEEISLKSLQSQRDTRLSLNQQQTSIAKQTESMDTMNKEFQRLETAIRDAIALMAELSSKTELTPEARQSLVNEITNGLKSTMKSCLKEAIRTTQETPIAKVTDEIAVLQATETEEQTDRVKTIPKEESK